MRVGGGRVNETDALALVIMAWNAHRAGETRSKLQMRRGGLTPGELPGDAVMSGHGRAAPAVSRPRGLGRDSSGRYASRRVAIGRSHMNRLLGYVIAGAVLAALAGCSNSPSGTNSDPT